MKRKYENNGSLSLRRVSKNKCSYCFSFPSLPVQISLHIRGCVYPKCSYSIKWSRTTFKNYILVGNSCIIVMFNMSQSIFYILRCKKLFDWFTNCGVWYDYFTNCFAANFSNCGCLLSAFCLFAFWSRVLSGHC